MVLCVLFVLYHDGEWVVNGVNFEVVVWVERGWNLGVVGCYWDVRGGEVWGFGLGWVLGWG